MSTEQRHLSGRAYRDRWLVCDCVRLTIGSEDLRLGLTRYERRYVLARFGDRLDPALRAELRELVRRRGAAARRVAETLEPIEIVVDDPRRGCQRLVARLEPPQLRSRDLREVEFGLQEIA
jgi:hypothetical protein